MDDERTWPSCGHLSVGVCFECYVQRGQRLAKSEQEVADRDVRISRMHGDAIKKVVIADVVGEHITALERVVAWVRNFRGAFTTQDRKLLDSLLAALDTPKQGDTT